MKLKAPILDIPKEDPFRNDLLGRKSSAETLTELIRSTEEPLVLCINAPWGEGKSTFLAMWRQMLVAANFKTLYFNAWENDFANDAFISLIAELDLGVAELSLTAETLPGIQEKLQKVKKLGAGLVKKAVPTAVKIATAGLVDLDELTEEALAEYSQKMAEEQINAYEESKKSVAGFKSQLRELAASISPPDESSRSLPLVVLVDELDRCRPPYAINVLEAVKHFFSVDNVVFVLALDREQLTHSVRSMYGHEMNAGGYLRRFIDIEYSLPAPTKGAFCKAQFGRFGFDEYFRKRNGRETHYDRGQIEETFSELFDALGFSLREQERCFTMLSLAIRSTPENYKLHPLLLSFLITLKLKAPERYSAFVTGQSSPKDVLAYVESSPKGAEFMKSNYGAAIEAYLVGCRSERFTSQELATPYKEIVNSPSSAADKKQRAERIIQLLESFDFRDSLGVLPYLQGKIDLVSNFRR